MTKADKSVDTWVSQVMSKNMISLSPKDSVLKAIELFREKGFHHLPLIDNNLLVGVVTATDVMWRDPRDFDNASKLGEFMNKIVIVCHENTPLDYLARVFYTEKINAMPVIDESGVFIGMITHHDILRWLFERQ